MSYEATDAVLKYSKAKSTERLVLLVIATHANPETGEAWPSIATLAAESAMGGRQVQSLIRRLEVSGELTIEQGTGRKNTNTYRLTCLKRVQDQAERVQDSTPFSDSERVQDSVQRVQDRVKRVQDSAERVFIPTPEPKEPNTTKEEPKNKHAQKIAEPVQPPSSQKSVAQANTTAASKKTEVKDLDTVPGGAVAPFQLLFGALALACYGGHDALTNSARSRVAAAAKSLNKAGYTGQDVPQIVAWVRETESWRDALTPQVIEERAPVWKNRGSLPVRVAAPKTIKFNPRPQTTQEANDRAAQRASDIYAMLQEETSAVF